MKSIVIRQIPDDVFEWLQSQAKAVVLSPEAWLRLKLIEMARKVEMKPVQQVAKEALDQARAEGMDDEDAKWMAVGAVNREARKQGVIPEDELTPEMNAASQAVVKQELKSKK